MWQKEEIEPSYIISFESRQEEAWFAVIGGM